MKDDKWVLHQALVERVVEGDGRASAAVRRCAFEHGGLEPPVSVLVDKVAERPVEVSN